jgi:hypothetical protein
MLFSEVVSKVKTVLLLPSNDATMFRVGDKAIKPGEAPALRRFAGGNVSFWPLIITNPPKTMLVVTLSDAKTRSVSLLPLVVVLELL